MHPARRENPAESGIDDLPQPRPGTQWWVFTIHLRDDGGEFGLTVFFVRHQIRRPDGTPLESHVVLWYRSDPRTTSHVGESWLDEGAGELAQVLLHADEVTDPRIKRAFTEALSRGDLPLPDRRLPHPVRIGQDGLDLDFGGVARLRKERDGTYLLEADGDRSGFHLRLTPDKPVIAQVDGDLRAYCLTRLTVTGSVSGERESAVRGQAWYRHGSGDHWRSDVEPAWEWVGLRLDNGWDVSVLRAVIVDAVKGTSVPAGVHGVLSSPDGERLSVPAVLRGSAAWTSLSTLNTYNTVWDVDIASHQLSLRVRTWFPEQEIRSLPLGSGILEAYVSVEGTMAGRPVSGQGCLEVWPANRIADIERFVLRARDLANASIDEIYPESPEASMLAGLAGVEARPELLEGVNLTDLHDTLVRPIRYAVEGAGKSWRTYAAIAALGMLRADTRKYRSLAGAFEIMHTACLVVDDVQDRSPVRRGRAAVHMVFGEATAINAGTAAYFVYDQLLRRTVPDDESLRLRVHEVFLQVMHAAHAGQALDIAGHRAAMDEAVATGEAEPLLRRIRTVHRLKTASVPRGMAQICGLFAGATPGQLLAMADYFEAIGLAYQITDDVADLRGVTAPRSGGGHRPTKHVAEDLRAGKVTMPLAHAVALLPAADIRRIWHTVRDGDASPAAVAEIARTLEDCGAVQACEREANGYVARAWESLEGLLPVTHESIMVRALGAYMARRERE
ncbi:polyprenyl synthetase family protein [Nonomuraea sp. NPDC049400]|uniref:polyprenyl synthetase family protein n=1 Tax=Nonomuraea sp. NPDC049400 TaxID=3364352 RepID=UPI0037A0E291